MRPAPCPRYRRQLTQRGIGGTRPALKERVRRRLTAVWERVVGQERAVGLLQRAAERPVHAYLLVGPRGSGLEDAARCFAAEVVSPEDDQRVQDLVVRGMHPDVVEFEP